jgi:hypothetical protein
MFLHVSNPEEIEENKIPPKALVTSDQSYLWSLFDKEPGAWHRDTPAARTEQNRSQTGA